MTEIVVISVNAYMGPNDKIQLIVEIDDNELTKLTDVESIQMGMKGYKLKLKVNDNG